MPWDHFRPMAGRQVDGHQLRRMGRRLEALDRYLFNGAPVLQCSAGTIAGQDGESAVDIFPALIGAGKGGGYPFSELFEDAAGDFVPLSGGRFGTAWELNHNPNVAPGTVVGVVEEAAGLFWFEAPAVGSAVTFAGARWHRSTQQVNYTGGNFVPPGIVGPLYAVLFFDVQDYDVGGPFMQQSTLSFLPGQNDRMVAPVTGKYHVEAACILGNQVGAGEMVLLVNGSGTIQNYPNTLPPPLAYSSSAGPENIGFSGLLPFGFANGSAIRVSTDALLGAGDYVQVVVAAKSAVGPNTVITLAAGNATFFSMHAIH
jgi:hypothetical protein